MGLIGPGVSQSLGVLGRETHPVTVVVVGVGRRSSSPCPASRPVQPQSFGSRSRRQTDVEEGSASRRVVLRAEGSPKDPRFIGKYLREGQMDSDFLEGNATQHKVI